MTVFAIVFPFALLLGLVLVLRRPLWQGGGLALLAAVVAWSSVPGVTPSALFPPILRAFIVATEVGLILLGAITFLEYLNRIGTTQRIESALNGFTGKDRALKALLLAWLFCGFLEGAAGFGAPAALVAPLLASLGFPALSAAILPLIGDSAAVPFGAVGTPVRVGFDGLVGAASSARHGAAINLLVGWLPPLFIYGLVRRLDRGDGQGSDSLAGPGWAVWAGFCYTVPAFALVWIGPEFPSLAGSLIGVGLFSLSLLRGRTGEDSGTSKHRFRALLKAFAPYLGLCLLLLGGKLLLGGRKWHVELFGSAQALSVFQPGLVFLFAIALLALWRRQETWRELRDLLVLPGRRLPAVWLAIFCMACLAQFTVQLSDPKAGLGSIFSGSQGAGWLILIAPLAGAAGSFMTGSATVSNLLCAPFLVEACALTGADPALILGLQLIGAGAGNMISLQNLVAVQATVGLANQEAAMLKQLWRPCLAYLTAATLAGWILSSFGNS
jgi:lactate permease